MSNSAFTFGLAMVRKQICLLTSTLLPISLRRQHRETVHWQLTHFWMLDAQTCTDVGLLCMFLLVLQFPKWTTLAFALYCQSSVTTSSRMHEKQAVENTSQCTPHGHVCVEVVWMPLASRLSNCTMRRSRNVLSMAHAWEMLT